MSRLNRASRPASWRRVAAAVVSVVALLAGCAGGRAPRGNAPMRQVGSWRLAVTNQPNPPRVGDNTLTIVAEDLAGRPLRGSVDVTVTMAAMGAMTRMESRGRVLPTGHGTFRATYGLAVGGEWQVTVLLHPDQGPETVAEYRLSTLIPGLADAGGTPVATPAAASLTPAPSAVSDAAADSGAVSIDAARREALGIRTEVARVRPLATTLRAPGRVAYDESRRADVTLRFAGWVRRLDASVTGQRVARDQVLFAVYSPELWSAQQEYLEAARAAAAAGDTTLLGSSRDLARAARMRLTLMGLAAADVEAMARAGRPLEAFPIRSPAAGVIVEKDVVPGSAFQAGQVLLRIAAVDPVWVIASLPQQDAAALRPGMTATIRGATAGAADLHGRVAFVAPALDSTTRTLEVRITIAHPGPRLRLIPGMFVDVELAPPARVGLAIPQSAVLPTGERSVVFVDLGDGRLAPRDVRLGARAGELVEVLSGLSAGDRVVTSGNFLVSAESQLHSAERKW